MEDGDLGNDSINWGLESCAHGRSWHACQEADCQEIWRIYQKGLEEIRKLDNQRPFSKKALKYWSEQKSEYEIELDKKSRDLKPEDYEIKLPAMPLSDEHEDPTPEPKRPVSINFRTIFPDELTLRAAVQFRALTLWEGRLMEAYLRSDESLPAYKRWEAIGEKIGCSGKTVARHFQQLVGEFLRKRKDGKENDKRPNLMAVHVRGERGVHFYRRHQLRFDQWIREMRELITDRATLRELRKKRELVEYSEATPVPLELNEQAVCRPDPRVRD